MSKEGARQRIPELESVCKVRPSSLLLGDLAACYFTLDDPERALPLAQQAWAKNKNSGIGMNLALILKDLGRHDESFHVIEEAYWLDASDFYIKLGYGEALLKAGYWKQAWPIYDNARPTQQGAAYDLRLPRNVREWNGEPLPEGHRLLVINEGGTGDRISYPRWLPELTKLGINWAFYPYGALSSFFERIFPREQIIKDGDDIVATHWTTAFALPAKLNIGPNEVPPPLPITASPEHIEKYKMTVPDGLPMVGLCYSAAEKFQGDRKVRSMSEGQAIRLVCQTGDKVHYVSLQHGETMPYPVTNVPFESWEDLAGMIHNLDAVISVDTSVMHFAGAMGKPVAAVLSANSCWKFLRTGKKLPLYPTATFYRNRQRGFEDAINELVTDIRSGAWPT
jgi:hypothetical protein